MGFRAAAANTRGVFRQRVCPRVCYNVINIMIYGRRGYILFG